ALTLSGQLTLLHKILYLLPVFDRLHPNASARVMVVFFLGSALLAGTALTALMERSPRPAYFAFLPALAALFLATRAPSTTPERVAAEVSRFDGWGTRSPALIEAGVIIPPAPLVALILTVALAATLALFPDRLSRWRLGISVVLVLVVFVDLFGSGKTSISNHISAPGGAGLMTRLDVSEYYAPTGRVQFLRSAGEDPSRYLTYAPGFRKSTSSISSPLRFAQPETPALGAGNRAAVDGLQSVQGYNALRLALYDEYMLELNGDRKQNYHYADVLAEESLRSPLLDLLGVRHIVVPAGTGEDREPSGPEQEFPAVHEDDQVKVLERSEALPRAWIVHSAQSATPKEALRLLSSGEVDPRETALLEDPLPDLANSDDPSADRASVTEYGPDEILLNTTTDASSLLMLSEVYYPAWNAYIDGERVPLYRADHLLRAIPIPAGEHTVELRYESRSLQAGMIISLATILALLA
ncbi:MAG: YfhO family protein, partial [Rubrobacter sp.]